MPYPIDRSLTKLAWVNVAVHFAGLVALLLMMDGTPVTPLPERIAYLSAAPLAWAMGWAIWILCAAALIAFLAVLTHRLGEKAAIAKVGLTIAIVGAGFDLFCDSVYIAAFPMIAGLPETLFVSIERIIGIGSMVVANGLYGIGIFLICIELSSRPEIPKYIRGLGFAVSGFAGFLSFAGFTGVVWHAQMATALAIPSYCAWVILLARSIEKRRDDLVQ